jgi:hypothetical protein
MVKFDQTEIASQTIATRHLFIWFKAQFGFEANRLKSSGTVQALPTPK